MYLIIGLVVAATLLYLVLTSLAPKEIYKVFGLRNDQYEIIGSDLGKGHPRKRIYGFGLGGESDALFKAKGSGRIVVGEFKNRKHKGYVRHREYYQVLLYIGLARETFKQRDVIGVLAFNDAIVEIPFDQCVFDGLVAMRGEALASIKAGKAADRRPLHKRIHVRPQNQKIRFPK